MKKIVPREVSDSCTTYFFAVLIRINLLTSSKFAECLSKTGHDKW